MPSVPDSPHGPVEDRHVGRRVLLADDNATNLEVLSRMLQLEKVVDVQLAMVSTLACLKPRWNRADQIQNGKEALDKVKADMALGQRYDIIFMDIQVRPTVPSLGFLRPVSTV